MADRRYKLINQGLPGNANFKVGDLAQDDIITWDATLNKWVAGAAGSGVPDGTAAGDMLDWDGSTWQISPAIRTESQGVSIYDPSLGDDPALRFYDQTDTALAQLQSFNTHVYLDNKVNNGFIKFRGSLAAPGDTDMLLLEPQVGKGATLSYAAGATGTDRNGLVLVDTAGTTLADDGKAGIEARNSDGDGLGWLTWYNGNAYLRVGVDSQDANGVGTDGSFVRIDGWNGTNNEVLAMFVIGGEAGLYHDGIKTFVTTSTGAAVRGDSLGSTNLFLQDLAATGRGRIYTTSAGVMGIRNEGVGDLVFEVLQGGTTNRTRFLIDSGASGHYWYSTDGDNQLILVDNELRLYGATNNSPFYSFYDDAGARLGYIQHSTNMYFVNEGHGGNTILRCENAGGSTLDLLTLDPDADGISMNNALGDRFALYGGLDAAASYALGIESSTLFYRANGYHRWYSQALSNGGTGCVMELAATNGLTGPTTLHVRSNGDAVFKLEADVDNVTETHNPWISWVQDGALVTAQAGLTGAANALPDGTVTTGVAIAGNSFVAQAPGDGYNVVVGTVNQMSLTTTVAKFEQPIYPDGQDIGHILAVSGNYGSIQVEGGDGSSSTSWDGINVSGRSVFMNISGTDNRLYNDTNNENYAQFVENGTFRLYYNGVEALETNSIGNVTIDNLGAALHHGTALTSARVTTSTAAPSGGTNGDVWFRY